MTLNSIENNLIITDWICAVVFVVRILDWTCWKGSLRQLVWFSLQSWVEVILNIKSNARKVGIYTRLLVHSLGIQMYFWAFRMYFLDLPLVLTSIYFIPLSEWEVSGLKDFSSHSHRFEISYLSTFHTESEFRKIFTYTLTCLGQPGFSVPCPSFGLGIKVGVTIYHFKIISNY